MNSEQQLKARARLYAKTAPRRSQIRREVMSYIFNSTERVTLEQKIQDLKADIQRFTQACQSNWPRPVDYTNLIDAQYALKALKESKDDLMQKGKTVDFL